MAYFCAAFIDSKYNFCSEENQNDYCYNWRDYNIEDYEEVYPFCKKHETESKDSYDDLPYGCLDHFNENKVFKYPVIKHILQQLETKFNNYERLQIEMKNRTLFRIYKFIVRLLFYDARFDFTKIDYDLSKIINNYYFTLYIQIEDLRKYICRYLVKTKTCKHCDFKVYQTELCYKCQERVKCKRCSILINKIDSYCAPCKKKYCKYCDVCYELQQYVIHMGCCLGKRMCVECTIKLRKDSCPFCRENLRFAIRRKW